MKTRTITGIFITAVFVAVVSSILFFHKIFYDIFVLLLIFGASIEVSQAITKKFSKPINTIIVIQIIAGYIVFYFADAYFGQSAGITSYFAVLALMFIVSVVVSMFSKIITIRNVISTMFVMVYPVSVLVYMLGLAYLPGSSRDLYPTAILLMFLVSTLTDTFAYLVGSTVKGKKLCPRISPKKTISGAVGGVFGGLIGAGLVLMCSILGWLKVPVISENFALNITHFMILGVMGSIFTQLGDLIASYIKRQCEIKDYSKLLPGHGGIMDRIDGFMINAVFIYIYFLILSF